MKLQISVILVLALSPVFAAPVPDMFTSSQIDAMFTELKAPTSLVTKTNYVIMLRSYSGPAGAWTTHADADEFWFVRRGSARLIVADYTLLAGVAGGSAKPFTASTGDIVSMPRSKAYRLEASGGRFDYIAVRIFPAAKHSAGAATDAKPMPTIATSSSIGETLEKSEQNVSLHSAGPTLINQVIYDRAPGPWEVHMTCDDLYFWRLGTAKAEVDGTLLSPNEIQPGEIRGVDVTGSREYTVGPGDFVHVPRNTAHHIDPGDGKAGYLLVKICD